jgi:hypothetical protein
MNQTLSTPAAHRANGGLSPWYARCRSVWIALPLILSAASCERADREASIAAEADARQKYGMAPAPVAPPAYATDAAEQSTTGTAAIPAQFADTAVSLIIRSGEARIEVTDIRAAVTQLRELAQRVGGHVASSSYHGGREEIRAATLELKVPAARYDEAVAALDRVGRVEYVNSRAEDAGEEYADASARLANARRLEERLLALLTSRTGKLEEVLAVERELARVRGEIERIEGRLRYLRTRAAMSTLTVTAHEPEPLLGGRPGENPFSLALQRAWRNFVGLLAGLIAALGIIVPLGALAVAGWYGGRRVVRLVRSRRSAPQE